MGTHYIMSVAVRRLTEQKKCHAWNFLLGGSFQKYPYFQDCVPL